MVLLRQRTWYGRSRSKIVYGNFNPENRKVNDKTFIYDAWSCRAGKGLLGAIERTQAFLSGDTPWVWKCDVRKFFDSVDQDILLKILSRRTKDSATFNLLKETIYSFSSVPGGRGGIPIGNLSSQIFANIYLNELDRYMKHEIGVRGYLRYGDDFIVVENDLAKLEHIRAETIKFLNKRLKLQVNSDRNKIMQTSQGLQILGVKIWPSGRVLNKRNQARIYRRLTHENVSSYYGLISKHGNSKQRKIFDWTVCAEILPTQLTDFQIAECLSCETLLLTHLWPAAMISFVLKYN